MSGTASTGWDGVGLVIAPDSRLGRARPPDTVAASVKPSAKERWRRWLLRPRRSSSSTVHGPTRPASTPRSAPCSAESPAIGFANPLRDLAGDAAYLAEFLRSLTGPIVLVGHSYGGNVISMRRERQQPGAGALLFNGWMCDESESQQQLLERFEGSLVGLRSGLCRSPTRTGARALTSSSIPELFREAFAADVDPRRPR